MPSTQNINQGARVSAALLKFERGEIALALVRRGDRLVWLHGRTAVGRPLATEAAAVRFLRAVCEAYNCALGLLEPRGGGPDTAATFCCGPRVECGIVEVSEEVM